LQVITVRSIPFPKHTIWLIKILALITGAGGVFGATTELGMSWLFGTLLSGVVIFFALRDSVQDISHPSPFKTHPLRMFFPWFLGQAVAAKNLRLLRAAEGRERNP
jgi:hypothetical protein